MSQGRRWRGWVVTVLRLGNAALLAAVMFAAVRSYWVQDFVRTPDFGPVPAAWVKSGGGELLVQVFLSRETHHRGVLWKVIDNDGRAYLSDDVLHHAYGFGFDPHAWWPTVVMPWWAIAMPLTVWPIWWLLWDRMRWRRLMAGRCVGCGYDLTHTDAAHCPECGRPRNRESGLMGRLTRWDRARRAASEAG